VEFEFVHVIFYDHDAAAMGGKDAAAVYFIFDLVKIDFMIAFIADTHPQQIFFPDELDMHQFVYFFFIAVDDGVVDGFTQGNFNLKKIIVADLQYFFYESQDQNAQFRVLQVALESHGDFVFILAHEFSVYQINRFCSIKSTGLQKFPHPRPSLFEGEAVGAVQIVRLS
jgi:hypothetical protein